MAWRAMAASVCLVGPKRMSALPHHPKRPTKWSKHVTPSILWTWPWSSLVKRPASGWRPRGMAAPPPPESPPWPIKSPLGSRLRDRERDGTETQEIFPQDDQSSFPNHLFTQGQPIHVAVRLSYLVLYSSTSHTRSHTHTLSRVSLGTMVRAHTPTLPPRPHPESCLLSRTPSLTLPTSPSFSRMTY